MNNPATSRHAAAGDVAAAVKLYLERLDAPGRAAALVRKAGGGAPAAAAAVARHCLAAGDHRAAVEFLLLAGEMDQVAGGAAGFVPVCIPAMGRPHAGGRLHMKGLAGPACVGTQRDVVSSHLQLRPSMSGAASLILTRF
jgi:hypothetical protein